MRFLKKSASTVNGLITVAIRDTQVKVGLAYNLRIIIGRGTRHPPLNKYEIYFFFIDKLSFSNWIPSIHDLGLPAAFSDSRRIR